MFLGRCVIMGFGVAQNVEQGLDYGKESAAAGSCFGQFVLGRCHHDGLGVEKDRPKAEEQYRLAAKQRYSVAQVNLGFILAEKQTFDTEAVRFFRLAAEQGQAHAQYNLGFMFANGRGVQKDDSEALKLYHLSAAQRCEPAVQQLRLCGS